jgi:NAD(P)-dependent dehydrogenase (short-subunit alcohol dehydrogenase family)
MIFRRALSRNPIRIASPKTQTRYFSNGNTKVGGCNDQLTKSVDPSDLRQSLHSRRCLISGGNSGIGYAVARRFLQAGAAKVTILGRNKVKTEKAAQSLRETVPRGFPVNSEDPVSTITGDVAQPDFWKELATSKAFDYDVLVNSAGISYSAFLLRTPDKDIESVIDINLKGTALACKYVHKAMARLKRKDRDHCIVNVSSLRATHGGRGASIYAASKAGVMGKCSKAT